MHYTQDAQGDWGTMQGTDSITVATEHLAMTDGCKIFLRSWKTHSSEVLLILHGLGAHSGWFIDMGNQLAARGLNVYAMDHRGFGHSEGFRGHIEHYQTYVEDIAMVIDYVRGRHPQARLYILGHSLGGVFATHLAAKYGDKLAGVLFLNPAAGDTLKISQGTRLALLWGGITKSKKYWALAGGVEVMTTNAEACQMLNADPYWVRAETASFWFQMLVMRMEMLNKARLITIPAFVMQAEDDKVVVISASDRLYKTLASSTKKWKIYPGYDHDCEFEADRSEMDNDIVSWIRM